MADPQFPFEIGRREGRLTRPIMCRRCAAWTAFDGTSWCHADGTPACVQPDELHNQQPTKETTMKTATKSKRVRTNYGKASVMGALPELTTPKGLTEAQQAEFDRAAAQRRADTVIPVEFETACELIPPLGQPFATPKERTDVAGLIKKATAFAEEAGIDPESIDLIAKFTDYIIHTNTESRKPSMATKTTPTTKRGEKAALIFAINGKPLAENVNTFGGVSWRGTKNIVADTPRISPAELETLLMKEFGITTSPRTTPWGPVKLANGVTLQACEKDDKGNPVGLVTVDMPEPAKRTEKPAKATVGKAAVKPAPNASTTPRDAKGRLTAKPRAEGNLTRKTVTPLPKKSTAAAMRKPTTKATKALAELLP